jgi:VanZ family protein
MTVLLCAYWAVLFFGTHARLPPGAIAPGMDKSIHFFAYAVLGGLLIAVHATRGLYTWATVFTCWLILVGYGVFDELTQILVNRQCELYDWLYDVAGAATGLLLVTFAVWCFRPKIAETT